MCKKLLKLKCICKNKHDFHLISAFAGHNQGRIADLVFEGLEFSRQLFTFVSFNPQVELGDRVKSVHIHKE